MDQESMAGGGRLQHHGRGGELFIIFLVNVLLKIVTLGIYHFWAKTRVRRYLWSQTSVDGEHLEYSGTGLELFLAFLKVLGLFVLLGIGYAATSALLPLAAIVLGLVAAILWPVLLGAALYGANRYKLSRTQLRGIRFGLSGSAWDHGFKFLGYGILTVLTLGLYTPFMRMQLAAHTLDNTRFGNAQFQFSGRGSELFGAFFITWLFTLPTLGLIWFWYLAKEMRYRAEHTQLEGVRFRLEVSGPGLLGFWLVNLLLLLVTLGLAFPWVLCRSLRYMSERTRISGNLDYERILQAQRASDATGEGMVEALDLGVV
jgi:uncharacterized membrane protein YjgN (DUF898 family)